MAIIIDDLDDEKPDRPEREWFVMGIVHVTAKNRREATDKALRGDVDGPWEVLDDVGGFFRPEPL